MSDLSDQQVAEQIDQAFDQDFTGFSDRELLEHIAGSLAAIATGMGKMGDALPATLANPIYQAALRMILPKPRRGR